MKFVSTRGQVPPVTSAEAIRQGIAPDGGLYTPDTLPRLTRADLEQMAGQDYPTVATAVLALFLPDYPRADLEKMVAAAYAVPDKFSQSGVTPIRKLRDNQYILELYHGPTCAFKDVALQLLPHLLTKASQLTADSRESVILVATSGDTGKAALEGFKDVPGTKIIVFFPEQGVSAVQRLQMITQEGENTFVVAIKGNFDDAQNGVKQIFTDSAIIAGLAERQMTFSSANSINWGRLAPQIVYYIYGYLELCRRQAIRIGDPINVAVPTGNFGNILAAYIGKQMGLPIRRLICASNTNKVLTDFIRDGHYDRRRQFYTTISPSMDILISSNLERLLYYVSGANSAAVRSWMEELKTSGEYRVDAKTFAKIQADFYGDFADEAETQTTIKDIYQSCGRVVDTHTAVGQAVYQKYLRATGDAAPVLLASTASPFKFNTSVVQAIASPQAVAGRDEFELLEDLAKLAKTDIPLGLRGLEQKPVRHRTVCEPEQLGAVVREILKMRD